MYKKVLVISLITVLAIPVMLSAHCQIPCGIYDDEVRFKLMREHVETIEKSIKEIDALTKGTLKNENQLVRWVMNKDHHADKLSEIVTYYFMAQRVKPADSKDKHAYDHYKEQLELLHRILVQSMKAKQNSDLKFVEELNQLIDKFEKAYNHKH
ncbi:MAG: superoxide dismutase [Ni] [Fidelibacterota bacterium]